MQHAESIECTLGSAHRAHCDIVCPLLDGERETNTLDPTSLEPLLARLGAAAVGPQPQMRATMLEPSSQHDTLVLRAGHTTATLRGSFPDNDWTIAIGDAASTPIEVTPSIAFVRDLDALLDHPCSRQTQ